ncbi:MAG: methyltransferase domain-containing protein [Deltaproteobacteria bacterium]|nr:methyltransferase domain-containing protein [Deltaproteobacteria bacterium]
MSFEKDTLRDVYFVQQEKELLELVDPDTGMLSSRYSQLIPCPICESNRHSVVFIKRGYTFVRCEECELVFVNPQVLPDIVEGAYSGQKGIPASTSTDLWMEILLNEKEAAWRSEYFSSILSFIEKFQPQKSHLLDIGCGVGHFLSIARQNGWQTTGLELSEKGSAHCKKNGLTVFQKTIEEVALSADTFDVVTLLGVLEHMVDPKRTLANAVRVMKPGGVISVVVPNVYSLLAMILREKAVTFDGREHMIFFSADTLQKIFQKVGLEVLHCDTVLTGIHNIMKYMQFFDPYGENQGCHFLPEGIRHFCQPQGQLLLEDWILKNNLGLRLRIFGRRMR